MSDSLPPEIDPEIPEEIHPLPEAGVELAEGSEALRERVSPEADPDVLEEIPPLPKTEPDETARIRSSGNGRYEPVEASARRRRALHGAIVDPEAEAVVREVPADPPPVRGHDPLRGIETLLVPIFFAVIYGIIGYFVVSDGRIVSFDAMSRLNEAYMVWWNDPPKLAAIPLNVAPLGALAFLPLTLIKPLATSLVALPVLSAIAAGITVGAVGSVMRRSGMPALLRFPLLILFGLNPMFVYYAGNGEPVMLALACAAVAAASLVSWQVTGDTRYVVGAGLLIAVATMFDYGYALWALGFLVAFLAISSGRQDSSDRMRSTLLVFLAPAVYAISVWILLNAVLTGDPFGWITTQRGPIQVNTDGVLQGVSASLGGSLSDLFKVVLGIAPLAFLAAILMFGLGFSRKSRVSFGLLATLLFAAAVPVIRALVAGQADMVDLSVGLPLAMLATMAVAYAFRAGPGWRLISVLALVVGLVITIPLSWNAMKHYRFQNQAQAFTRYISDRDSQEGTTSVGGYTVGVNPELAMARYINEELPQKERSILVDENFSYGVMITSGRPGLFFDRADRGEELWSSRIKNPYGKVDYMLVATSRSGDQLRKAHPSAVEGGEPGMTPVFRTDRYVLLQVSESRPETSSGGKNNENQLPQSTPRPVTPQRPTAPSRSDEPAPVQTEPAETTTRQTGSRRSKQTSTWSGTSAAGDTSAPTMEGE